MWIRAEDGASCDSGGLCIFRVMPAASPLWLRGRPPRASQPSGWILVANRARGTGASLVCLARCAHSRDARQLLAALRRALDSGALSFDFAPLRWTRPCPEYRPMPRPAKFPQRGPQVLGGAP